VLQSPSPAVFPERPGLLPLLRRGLVAEDIWSFIDFLFSLSEAPFNDPFVLVESASSTPPDDGRGFLFAFLP